MEARWTLVRTTCTGVVRIDSTSAARPVPPPRVCTVRSTRQTKSTTTRSPYLRTFTEGHPPGDRPSARGAGLGRDRHLLQKIELIEHLAGAEGHARQRIVAHGDRQVRLLAEQEIQAAEQRTTTREHDALVHDVRRQLGRRALEAGAHRV